MAFRRKLKLSGSNVVQGNHHRRMKVLKKSSPYTWWEGSQSEYPKGDLDHVVAADHLQFRQFGNADVCVRGWPQKSGKDEKESWIEKYSDHALLYFEVKKK